MGPEATGAGAQDDREAAGSLTQCSEKQRNRAWELRTPRTYLVHFPQLPRQKEKQGQREQSDQSEVQRPPKHERQETQASPQVPHQQVQLVTDRLTDTGCVLHYPRRDGTCHIESKKASERDSGSQRQEELTDIRVPRRACQHGILRRLQLAGVGAWVGVGISVQESSGRPALAYKEVVAGCGSTLL